VISAGSIYSEASEVNRRLSKRARFCDNCPWYSNEANSPNRLLLYL